VCAARRWWLLLNYTLCGCRSIQTLVAGGQFKCGLWLVVNSNAAQEDENMLPPCTSLEIKRITTVGCRKLLQCTPHVCTMRHYTDSLLFPWSSPNDPLTRAEVEELTDVWKEVHAHACV